MFEDKRYKVAGPFGGPGVLGPWKAPAGSAETQRRHILTQRADAIWTRIAGRARLGSRPGTST